MIVAATRFVILNDWTGQFQRGPDLPRSRTVPLAEAKAADVAGDGVADIVGLWADVGFPGQESYGLTLNDGQGSFGASIELRSGEVPERLELADFDGDGDVDAAFVSPPPTTPAIWTSWTPSYFSASPSWEGLPVPPPARQTQASAVAIRREETRAASSSTAVSAGRRAARVWSGAPVSSLIPFPIRPPIRRLFGQDRGVAGLEGWSAGFGRMPIWWTITVAPLSRVEERLPRVGVLRDLAEDPALGEVSLGTLGLGRLRLGILNHGPLSPRAPSDRRWPHDRRNE